MARSAICNEAIAFALARGLLRPANGVGLAMTFYSNGD